MTIDVKNFYLNTPLHDLECMKIHINLIPNEIVVQCNLRQLADGNRCVHIKITKGMCGLPQAGPLANKLLAKRLAKHGHHQATHTPGLWKHTWQPIQFTLIVDDFGVECEGKQHADHLIAALREHHTSSLNWDGNLCCGMKLTWDHNKRTIDISMPNCMQEVLHKFQHPTPGKPQRAPCKAAPKQCGSKIQLTEPHDKTLALPKAQRLRVQQIVGSSLCYGRAVDNTLLSALSAIATQQATATKQTESAAQQLLDNCAAHPDATIQFHASEMILGVHSNASCLSEPQAHSGAGGHFFLGNHKDDQFHNAPILILTTVICNVMSSVAKAELATLFHNAKEATILRTALQEMGHPQPPTPLQTDDSTASSIANDTCKQQRSRAIDMQFHWLRNRVKQKQFNVHWKPAQLNHADCFTKHHAPIHHQRVRPLCVYHPQRTPQALLRHQASARVC